METEQNKKNKKMPKKDRYVLQSMTVGKNENKFRKSIILVTIGTILYSFGVVWILQLCGFFSGGVTGTSQLIVGLIEKFGGSTSIRGYIGVFVFLINVPLLLIGWKGISKHFAILTIISIVLQSITMTLLSNLTISPFALLLNEDGNFVGMGIVDVIQNGNFNIFLNNETLALEQHFISNIHPGTKLLLAIIGGLLTGYGAALCLKGGGSTGGMDIITNYLVMKKRINFTACQFIVDMTIIVASSLISIENVLYTVVRLIIYMLVIQLIYQTYHTTRIEIITENAEKIKEELLKHFNHSMTIYDAIGGYTSKPKKVIEVYISHFETIEYISLINSIDPKAFIITTKVQAITGNYVQRSVV